MVNTRFSTYIKPELLGRLPLDLKREILETAAFLSSDFALRLAVVSRDVQPWAERIIYRELYFNGQQSYHVLHGDVPDNPTQLQKFKVALEARPPSFFAEYVRALHFDGTYNVEDILPVVQVCTGVTNFGMYASLEGPRVLEIVRIVHSLPLHTLFISHTNLTTLLILDAPLEPSETESPATSPRKHITPETSADAGSQMHNGMNPQSEVPLTLLTTSSLHTLKRLGLVDCSKYPTKRFPALTHLALVPDFEDEVLQQIKTSLENMCIESIVVMLNFLNAIRQTITLRKLRDIADSRLVLFTLSESSLRYIEDDLWDLANEFPDEEQPLTYLEEIPPGPKILNFQELLEMETLPKESDES
ncbi:hypothetical protein J132_06709 [Termitomyces sp. J132]|nr:hypothetical protein J132_06709 [Termitomyces sp. J132]